MGCYFGFSGDKGLSKCCHVGVMFCEKGFNRLLQRCRWRAERPLWVHEEVGSGLQRVCQRAAS